MTYESLGQQQHMTELENQLLAALLELESTVKAIPTAPIKPNLQPLFARLDELTRALPTNTDPNLLHYLHKKSYEKARLFLQGQDAANARGTCDRSCPSLTPCSTTL
jgi:hypothetical protein